MPAIRLVRSVEAPTGRGPGNGMCALQRALREARPPWLEIGGDLRMGEVPWVWSAMDSGIATFFAEQRWPFIIGPNVLFDSANAPGRLPHEKTLLAAESCLLQFTESEWYSDLIRRHCAGNRAPLSLWSYPIDPQPAGPLPAEFDVLLYQKSFRCAVLQQQLDAMKLTTKTIRYGAYTRQQLFDAARRARCCVYGSIDDRGPLALAEILLAGCPCIGVPHGAPWIVPGVSGLLVGNLAQSQTATPALLAQWSSITEREAVRAWAVDRFATARTVEKVLTSLEPIAAG